MDRLRNAHRYRLHRAGVFNVWEYDEQVFDIVGGRLLLRGTNGAGKSKTLEMLLPFVIDGDQRAMEATGQRRTSLRWLMSEGADQGSRVGYVWVEFVRAGQVDADDPAEPVYLTCGVGIRLNERAAKVTPWFFTTTRRVGVDLSLDDDAGPLTRSRLADVLGGDGVVFDGSRQYRAHVGRTLFGLDEQRYDDLLRLLYWLRQPQVGEDLEPVRVAERLSLALPEIDDAVVRETGDAFDQLVALGEQVERRVEAVDALTKLAEVYHRYAAGVVGARADDVLTSGSELSSTTKERDAAQAERDAATDELRAVSAQLTETKRAHEAAQTRASELERGPLADVLELLERARDAADAADREASAAHQGAGAAVRRAEQSRARADAERGQWVDRVAARAKRRDDIAARVADVKVPLPVEPPLPGGEPEAGDALNAVPGLADGIRDTLDQLRQDVTGRLSTIDAVRQAHAATVEAGHRARTADEAAETMSRSADEAADRSAAAQAALAAEAARYWRAVQSWASGLDVDHVDGSALIGAPLADTLAASADGSWPEPAEDVVRGLARQAASATAPRRAQLRADEQAAASEAHRLRRIGDEHAAQRDRVAAQTDPEPDPPSLGRDDRSGLAGVPLWRLVDPVDPVADAELAGVEAALQAAGLLDALVLPDGAVLDADRRDVVLTADAEPVPSSVATVLRPAAGAALGADVVRGVLARIALVESVGPHDSVTLTGPAPRGGAVVGRDGSWRLGALVGRAVKRAAQYIGVVAREAERRRRLAELNEQIEANAHELAVVEERLGAARAAGERLDAWLADVPDGVPVLQAMTSRDRAAETLAAAERRAAELRAAATQARARLTARRAELDQLSALHDLPSEPALLAEVERAARDVLAYVAQDRQALVDLVGAAARLRRDLDQAEADLQAAGEAAETAEQAGARAELAAAQRDAVVERHGAESSELQAQANEARAETRRLAGEVERLDREEKQQIRREATAASQATEAAARVVAASTQLTGHLNTWRAVAGLDGVLAAALTSPRDDASEPVLSTEELGTLRAVGPSLRPADRALLRRLRSATSEVRPADVNNLLRAFDEAKTGAAADHEPTRVQDADADVFVLYARDHSMPLPLGEALGRLRAAAAAQEAALSERQREVFEDHLLGMLGDQLRQRRREAGELVDRMNEELASVRSSQGIGVRLQWALKEDASPTVRRAAELLNEPIGRLLPEARRELLDGLMELVESVRAQQRELGYAEHLKAALDYRSWSAFRLMLRRGGEDHHEVRLTRRTALSQGEQKVVSYLPLFAAAAAHFDAVGEGAPHAPRFVLLDDAFPKIDAPTHPRLFGLLVALDLDWVMTSERLTGMYDTVPEQSIYEASRRPGIRGILQYQFRWRGRRLEAVPEADRSEGADEGVLLDPGRVP